LKRELFKIFKFLFCALTLCNKKLPTATGAAGSFVKWLSRAVVWRTREAFAFGGGKHGFERRDLTLWSWDVFKSLRLLFSVFNTRVTKEGFDEVKEHMWPA